jgi:hypothetical protein
MKGFLTCAAIFAAMCAYVYGPRVLTAARAYDARMEDRRRIRDAHRCDQAIARIRAIAEDTLGRECAAELDAAWVAQVEQACALTQSAPIGDGSDFEFWAREMNA